jgi:hypothetical protein
MAEYAALQEWLLFRTWRFGLLFSGYLLLAASGEVGAAAAAVGVGGVVWAALCTCGPHAAGQTLRIPACAMRVTFFADWLKSRRLGLFVSLHCTASV